MNDFLNRPSSRDIIPGILLVSLLVLSYMVLREFLLSLIWAFIITYVTWPAYRWLRRQMKGRKMLSALVMTLIISMIIFLSIFWLVALLQKELAMAYQTLSVNFSLDNLQLPDAIKRIPGLGDYLQDGITRLSTDRAGVAKQLANTAQHWLGDVTKFLGSIGNNLVKLAIILVTVFFCFRDGEEAVRQLHQGLIRFLGKHQHVYLQAAGHTTNAVVFGMVLAALAQGTLAGLGFSVAGVQAPVLFGALTALFALIPMGAPLIWLPIAVGLIFMNKVWAGIGLIAWGVLVVSTVDNVIRPLVISGASRVPLLVVMFGVFGGLTAFGVIGIFLGPVILATLRAVWHEWLDQQKEEESLLVGDIAIKPPLTEQDEIAD
ncbi:AI-2E family transporter [Methylobacter sp. BlB1]|uniref:AI-2E family transporter n=1 Tax=Methylobacter sp. BlB1 TaxID=2785914 RepID=UPI00189545F0|nr:AI-2E family transporter [Methylobacter sp. BlB1]MBF6650242.1 AI-2E family transporter [Methylobacter sp. BlB1]